MDKFKEKLSNRLDKSITSINKRQKIRKNNKIWFWLILIPPYGIYRAFKNKAFNPILLSIFTIIFSLTVFVGVYNKLYPNKVLEGMMKSNIEHDTKLGEVRRVSKIGSLDDKYIIYNALTTTGNYDIYVNPSQSLSIVGINEISPDTQTIKLNDDLKYLTDIDANIIRFMNIKSNKDTYGTIVKNIETVTGGNTIETTKGIYTLTVKNNTVVSITTKSKDNLIEEIYTNDSKIEIPLDILKVINKNSDKLGTVEQVLSNETNNEVEVYIYRSSNGYMYKAEKTLDGTINVYKQQT